MMARTDANLFSLISVIMGIFMLVALLLFTGPVVNATIQSANAGGNPQSAAMTAQVISPIIALTSMMQYIIPIIIVIIVVLAYWRTRQGTDLSEPASQPVDPSRYGEPAEPAPRREPIQVQAVTAQAKTGETTESEEKKPEKRDRYRAVRV